MGPQTAVDAKPARPSSLKPASVASSQPSATAEPAKPGAEPATVNLPSAPQPVEFHGCTALRDSKDGPVCMLTPDDKLVFWVRDRTCDSLAFAEGGQAISFTGSIVQGGCQARITSSTTQVHTALQISDRSTAQFIYSILLDRSKPRLLQWTWRMWDRALQDIEDVNSELRRLASQQEDIESIIDVTYARAIAFFRVGNRELANRELQNAFRLAMQGGYSSIAFDVARRQVFNYIMAGLHAEARSILYQMESLVVSSYGRREIELQWHRGLVERAIGNYPVAVVQIRRSYLAAERVRDLDFLRIAHPILVELLVSLDQISDLEKLIDTFEYLLAGAPDCERASLLNTMAFAGLLVFQGHGSDSLGGSPMIGKSAVRDLFGGAIQSRMKCREDGHLANIYMGLATLEMAEGRLADALSWSTKAKLLKGRSISTELGLLELDALIALKEGKVAESLRLFAVLDNFSSQHPDESRTEMACRAAIGKLEALYAMGRDNQLVLPAVRSCITNAENLLDPPLIRNFERRAKLIGALNQ